MVNVSSVAGRVTRSGSGVYNLTKHGVGAFSESLRQELADQPSLLRVLEVQRDGEPLLMRDSNQVAEILQGAQLGMHGLVPALLRANRPWAPGFAGGGANAVVGALAMAPSDGMNRR